MGRQGGNNLGSRASRRIRPISISNAFPRAVLDGGAWEVTAGVGDAGPESKDGRQLGLKKEMSLLLSGSPFRFVGISGLYIDFRRVKVSSGREPP
jgi:hypothetical protein